MDLETSLKDRLYTELTILSGPELGGRLSGTEGAKKTAAYLASQLQQAGFTPLAEDGFTTPVNVAAARLMGPARLRVGSRVFRHRVEFAEWLPISAGGIVEGELMTVRDGEDINPEQLKGKVVLIPEQPEDFDIKGTVETAAELGVKALLIESGEPAKHFPKTIHGTDHNKIPVLRVRRSIVEELSSNHSASVHLELPLSIGTLLCQNVLGLLEGSDTTRTLLLSAHYDHLGDDPEGLRFPGTIDNGSGVAVVLELARRIAKREKKLPFNLLVAFFTGEESGLKGARHLADHPPLPIDAVINLDCLGFEPELFALRTGHKEPGLPLAGLAAEVISARGIEVRWIKGGEDSIAFTEKGIPSLGLGQKPTLTTSISIHTFEDRLESIHMKPLIEGHNVITEILDRIALTSHWNLQQLPLYS